MLEILVDIIWLLPVLPFFLGLEESRVVAIGQSCCCGGCPICTYCNNGCVTDPGQEAEVCGSVTDGYGTRDKYCCDGLCTDTAFDDSNCGGCGISCFGQICCNGSCQANPC